MERNNFIENQLKKSEVKTQSMFAQYEIILWLLLSLTRQPESENWVETMVVVTAERNFPIHRPHCDRYLCYSQLCFRLNGRNIIQVSF